MREFCRTWPNQQKVTVPGIHFIQEASGTEIGAPITWLKTLGVRACDRGAEDARLLRPLRRHLDRVSI